ncbi:MAG: asparagine synthase (glutamine-hydrolyzing) [Pseudomonadota bacterium]
MCGIAGIALHHDARTERAEEAVRSMCMHMARRGPDAQRVVSLDEGRTVLGHRRLAIVDLAARADQPMQTRDGRFTLTYNGEIYNFLELRSELEEQGAKFVTHSDTEVLLELYRRDGAAMLARLRGMFAFAIWDAEERELFAARDAYGIKPLYIAELDGGVAFASQVKTLLASGLVSKAQDPAGLAGFYLWGHVPEPWTLYSSICAVPAGHWLTVQDGKVTQTRCWHRIARHWQVPAKSCSAEELQARVTQEVERSVEAHLTADVPVSVFLSGGIDSGAVSGHAAALGTETEGITIGFAEFAGRKEDEVPVARELAAHFSLPQRVRMVSRAEFEQDLPLILDAMDQPSVDGVNTWFASKAAAEAGYKVVLSGVGGDELFYGYRSFRNIPKLARIGRMAGRVPGLSALMRPAMQGAARLKRHPKLAAITDYWQSEHQLHSLQRGLFLPHELPELMGADEAAYGLEALTGVTPPKGRDGAATVGLLESTRYLRNQLLRDSDWASMAHSLELRTPLVDTGLLSGLAPYSAQFTEGRGKALLANSPQPPLPEHIANRRKTGFSVPMVRWLAEAAGRPLWDRVPMLSGPSVPWARRWAYALQQQNAWRAA